MDLSIYDLITRLLAAGERIKWVSFHPTMLLELNRVGQHRVPYDQRLTLLKAKPLLENMPHDKKTPKIRIHTDRREIFVSPAELAQVVWHNAGTIETITLPVTADQDLEAAHPGATA